MGKIICCHRATIKQRKQSCRAPLTMWHKETSLLHCFYNYYFSCLLRHIVCFLEGLLGLWRTRNPEGRAPPLAHDFISEELGFLEMEKMFLMFTLLFLLLDNSIYYKCRWMRNRTLKSRPLAHSNSGLSFPAWMLLFPSRRHEG